MDWISLQVSESLLVNGGDFLLRDSQSIKGGFVLTCRWEQETIHLPIRKTVIQAAEAHSRTKYSLEGEAFDSIPDLVHYYVGSRAALTLRSRAQINQPVNRRLPLSFLETAFRGPSNQRELKEDRMRDKLVCPSRWSFTLVSALFHYPLWFCVLFLNEFTKPCCASKN